MRLELVSWLAGWNELARVSIYVDQPCDDGGLGYGGLWGLLYGGVRVANVPPQTDREHSSLL